MTLGAGNEVDLVEECNETVESITNMIIEAQDNAYTLGFKRGHECVKALVELVKLFALSGGECKGCNGIIYHDGAVDHRDDCPVNAALREAEGGGED